MDEQMKNQRLTTTEWLSAAVVAVLILVVGVGGFVLLATRYKPPAKEQPQLQAPLVEAIRIHPEDLQMTVAGFGTARARRSVQIVPQVSGRVIAISPSFMEGAFFQAGEPLVSIDRRDYELALHNVQAAVTQAEYQLQQEEAEAEVARREWQDLKHNDDPPSPLVLRQPQIKNARAQLQAAQAQVATAELNLERTVISLPFNGRIVQKNVDVGQFVTPGQDLGSVYGTEVVEIVVPLEDTELAWFNAPLTDGNGEDPPGAEAVVTADFAGGVHKWRGRVVRTQGRIDPTSRMINVIAEVNKPFEEVNDGIPLTPGMFVRVEIAGKHLANVIRVPRYAVHNQNQLWVVRDGKLRVQKVEIARGDEDYAYITSGIRDGDEVITSPLDVVTDGMDIRVQAGEAPADVPPTEER